MSTIIERPLLERPAGNDGAGVLYPDSQFPELDVRIDSRFVDLLWVMNEALNDDLRSKRSQLARGFRTHHTLVQRVAELVERRDNVLVAPVSVESNRHYVSKIKKLIRDRAEELGINPDKVAPLFEHNQKWGPRLTKTIEFTSFE